ncbi:hypothetical protein Scep_019295 [Stephania cephalantha]|uniref:RNase H type-1 domain-containing protein n=1 Tax=Stephania cephalantha TaxID=152367 RepID=A0AAP0NPP9_9MAGN
MACKGPLKARNFLWRAAKSFLLTTLDLHARRVPIDTLCLICQCNHEGTFHALVERPAASPCWTEIQMSIDICQSRDFINWLNFLFEHYPCEEVEMATILCWSIWNNRNSKLWKNRTKSPTQIVQGARTNLLEWQRAQEGGLFRREQVTEAGMVKWNKPKRGEVVCNIDAGVFKAKGVSSYGALISDDEESFVAAIWGRIRGVLESREAEALGFREALSWLKGRNVTKVTIEGDAQVVVQALRSNVIDKSYFSSLICDCRLLLTDMRSYSVCFVRRSASLVAYLLAGEASLFSK